MGMVEGSKAMGNATSVGQEVTCLMIVCLRMTSALTVE
ncbi:hypothetical protein A2U01_0118110, partial [Trifolium medium]|nr:hypothetical protein [Trifolium medium]